MNPGPNTPGLTPKEELLIEMANAQTLREAFLLHAAIKQLGYLERRSAMEMARTYGPTMPQRPVTFGQNLRPAPNFVPQAQTAEQMMRQPQGFQPTIPVENYEAGEQMPWGNDPL